MKFVIYNDEVILSDELDLGKLILSDPFIVNQKVWFGFGGIPLLAENIALLKKQLLVLKRNLPELFTNDRELFRLCKRILNKNKFYLSGWLNIQLFLSPKGLDYLITSESAEESDFPCNDRGYLARFEALKKPLGFPHSDLYNFNTAFWRSLQDKDLHKNNTLPIILNNGDFVCEGTFSNIFMIKKNILITPSLSTACYNDVLRSVILYVAKQLQLKTTELDDISPDHLNHMDEIFFASEAFGMQWVLGVGSKRYIHNMAGEIRQQLNLFLEKRVKI